MLFSINFEKLSAYNPRCYLPAQAGQRIIRVKGASKNNLFNFAPRLAGPSDVLLIPLSGKRIASYFANF
ncbi:hypothetical protein A2Y83_05415 [Candidatus Falkowbacteria bacterium RBG_13_39_14]|uniref:Uncharacterized protein n=1 Tax=Candidatus Falkowbacteria bacterium RBG_13_39_14 TaxID=1797985 RepID=A0A1F5S4S4_9BACT|nr:MAG: hypothetical protein A2Y83_05415 [Candidatus Falkowbacteria bacterium RBG_13_39_14]